MVNTNNDLTQIMVEYVTRLGSNIANKLYVRYTPDVAQEVRAYVESDKYIQETCEDIIKRLLIVIGDYTSKYITEQIAPDLLKGDKNDIHTTDRPANNSNTSGPYTCYTQDHV